MEINDDRKPEDMVSHSRIVMAHDTFLSGWGPAENRKSYAAWACRPEDEEAVFEWVSAREEMRKVEVYDGGSNFNPKPQSNDMLHIYVVRDGHPAINAQV